MTKISLRGKITLFLFFFLMTFGVMFSFAKQMWVLAGISIFVLIAGIFGVVELVQYLNKLEEENKKFAEENKDKRIIQLSRKEYQKLNKNGFIDKDGERIENGDRGKEE